MDSNTPQKNARKHRENIEYLDCLLDGKALPQFCQQLWGAGVLWERVWLLVWLGCGCEKRDVRVWVWVLVFGCENPARTEMWM